MSNEFQAGNKFIMVALLVITRLINYLGYKFSNIEYNPHIFFYFEYMFL